MRDDASYESRGPRQLWMLFARAKYWSKKAHGPRSSDESVRPKPDKKKLVKLAKELCDNMAGAWRAGWKSEDLLEAAFKEMKQREDKLKGA